MGRWTAESDMDYFDEINPISLVMCERCQQHPVSLPEFDVLCDQCRQADAERGLQIAEAEERAQRRKGVRATRLEKRGAA
jgi:hypothetical protein